MGISKNSLLAFFFTIAASCNSLDYRQLQHRIFKVTSKKLRFLEVTLRINTASVIRKNLRRSIRPNGSSWVIASILFRQNLIFCRKYGMPIIFLYIAQIPSFRKIYKKGVIHKNFNRHKKIKGITP